MNFIMDTFVEFLGYGFSVCAYIIFAFVAVGSWFLPKELKED